MSGPSVGRSVACRGPQAGSSACSGRVQGLGTSPAHVTAFSLCAPAPQALALAGWYCARRTGTRPGATSPRRLPWGMTCRRAQASGAIAGAARGWWWGCPVSTGRGSRRGRSGRQISQQRTKRSGGPVVADRPHQHPARKARNSGHQRQQAPGVVRVVEGGRAHGVDPVPSAATAARVVGFRNHSAGSPACPGSPASFAPKSASQPATASSSPTP